MITESPLVIRIAITNTMMDMHLARSMITITKTMQSDSPSGLVMQNHIAKLGKMVAVTTRHKKKKGKKEQMKKVVKILKAIGNWCVFLFTGKGEIANEAIDEGLVDYSGQGRDKHGK